MICLMCAFDGSDGTKQQLNMSRKLDMAVQTGTIQPEGSVENNRQPWDQLNKQKRKFAWLEHHSLCCQTDQGQCTTCGELSTLVTYAS